MKSILQNLTLAIAIAVSVLVHGILLGLRFAAPDSFQFKPTDPGLEVILVNAKHDRKPLKAETLAQANLDGGGNAEAGRSKSPLPDMHKSEDGEGLKAMQRRIEELERQQQLLTQIHKKVKHAVTEARDAVKAQDTPPQPNGKDLTDSESDIHRREAEIAKNIEDYNKRPQKTMISPSTREVGYAMYYDTLRRKVEKQGTLNFPQKDGKKLYGELVLSIPVYQDGSIYERDGGMKVEKSSGNPVLDEAAKRIVRLSAPFAKFPPNMRTIGRDDVWILITNFKFTREGAIQANLRGGE